MPKIRCAWVSIKQKETFLFLTIIHKYIGCFTQLSIVCVDNVIYEKFRYKTETKKLIKVAEKTKKEIRVTLSTTI